MRKLLINVLLLAIMLAPVLSSCQKGNGVQEEVSTTSKMTVPYNPKNPYDYVGRLHNE